MCVQRVKLLYMQYFVILSCGGFRGGGGGGGGGLGVCSEGLLYMMLSFHIPFSIIMTSSSRSRGGGG